MKLAEILTILEEIAPVKYAQTWDNVGLLAGDPARDISRILLTIDLTARVLKEAISSKCELVIAYHPPIFQALKRLQRGEVAYDAIRAGIAIYSPHTALDVADGGTNDMLADVLGLSHCATLSPQPDAARDYKLVTFVPAEQVESVCDAIFAAGAGRIGKYTSCSFRSRGEGTFFGEAGTNPAVGKSGRLERAAEIRVETVVPIARVADVIAALRRVHPYEEPAFDLNQLAAAPTGRGMGQIGSLEPTPRKKILQQIKRGLRINRLLVAGPTHGTVKRAAVCAGSCGNLLHDAIAAKADLFLTGEVRHHDALKAAAAGMTVVCALHSNSERPVLGRLKNRLQKAAPALRLAISRTDRDPFEIV
jgi:dinuclear metal center YbgI/SA1388 family protein